MQTRTIRAGCSFVQPDGAVLAGGQSIDLDDDVAATHADRLDPLPVVADAVDVDIDATGAGDAQTSAPPAA